MPFTKTRGIRLERKKEPSLLNTLKRPYAIRRICVPFREDSVPCVKEGERVEAGQKVASPETAGGLPVFAGLTGRAGKILTLRLPEGRESSCLEILGEGEARQPEFTETKKGGEDLSADALLDLFRDRGLCSADPGMKPVHAAIAEQAPAKTVVINCCEQEPYVTSEEILISIHPLEVLKGAEFLRKAARADKAVLVFEDANREGFEIIKSKIYLMKWSSCEARTVPSVFPSWREDRLQEMFPGGAVAWNASTAYAACEAVLLRKPFFERIVTVGGECVAEPRNLWLPFGALFQDAVQACKGLLREPGKVVAGGPMTGTAQENLAVPVTAGTGAILALPGEITRWPEEEPCVRCNRCVDLCPASISPAMIALAAERDEFGLASEWDAAKCIECGVCSYVCPSKRPMTEWVRAVKERTGERS